MPGAASPSAAPGGRARAFWCFAVIAAAALLGYARSFHSPFEFDDFPNIVQPEAVHSPSLDTFFRFSRARLIPSLTFVLNYQLGGEETFGYHAVNFTVHLLATLAVFALVLALCRTPRLRGTWVAEQPLPLAAAAAVVFACHPIQVQAVTYIVQRVSSIATLFYVSSVLLYVRARNAQVGSAPGRPWLAYAGSALCALAAFLSKENSASLPVAILLTEWTFYPGRSTAKRLLGLAPFLALVIVIPVVWAMFGTRYRGGETLAARLHFIVDWLSMRARPVDQVSSLQYFYTQCTVIPRYLGMVLVPSGFNIDHDVPIAAGLSATVIAGLALLAALLGLGLYALRRWPLFGFGIVWIFVALSVESSFLPIQDPMVEHRMYLAMPGVAIALAVPFAWLWHRWRVAALVGGAVAVAGLCALTLMRNEAWRTPIALWGDALAKAPGKARVQTNYGTALYLNGRKDAAVPYFCKALELDPNYKQAELNLAGVAGDEMEAEGDGGELEVDVADIAPDGTLTVEPKDLCAKLKAAAAQQSPPETAQQPQPEK